MMVAYRKIVASAVHAGTLEWDPERRMPVDVVTALGMSDALGAALMRLRDGQDHRAAPRVLALLYARAKRAVPNVGEGMRMKLSRCALAEYLGESCRACGGTGQHIQPNGVATACTTCSATGIGRASDRERAQALGLPDARRVEAWAPKIAAIREILSSADNAVSGKLRNKLRQW